MDLDFEKICRTCLSSEHLLVSIFDENDILDVPGSESTLIDLLSNLMDIKISSDDPLPERICFACINEMKRVQNFRIRCKNSEILLNNYLNEKYRKARMGQPEKDLISNQFHLSPEVSITLDNKRQNGKRSRQTNDEGSTLSKRLKSSGVENSVPTDREADDIVCLDDDDNENEINQTDCDQIEISDDDHDDYDEEDADDDSGGQYDANGSYPIEAMNETDAGKMDESQSFLMPETSNGYCSQFDVSDMEVDCRECPKCTQLFESATDLKIHIKEQHTRGFQCNICKRVLKSHASLSAHITTHVPQFYPCPVCGFKVKQRKYLAKHLELHNGSKTHKCELCDELFYNMTDLRAHNFLAHPAEKDSPFKCHICGVKLPSQEGLTAHVAKHNQVVRSHVCSVCHKAFRDKTGLSTHYRVHTGEKPHVCQFCQRGFTTQYSLKMHVAIHTNEQFHKCAICFETFRFRSAMIKHMEDHRNNSI